MAWRTTTGRSVNMTEMERRVVYLRRNQPLTGRGPFHCTPWIRPTSTLVVNVEPLSDWPGSMCSQPHPLESDFRSILFLWRVSTDYVTYCERLSRYEIPRRSVSLASGWVGGYCLARHAEHTLRRRRSALSIGSLSSTACQNMTMSSLITPTIVLITGHFSDSTKFRRTVKIQRQRANSAARLEIPWPAENCWPYILLCFSLNLELFPSKLFFFSQLSSSLLCW